jgi:hypothetical protein
LGNFTTDHPTSLWSDDVRPDTPIKSTILFDDRRRDSPRTSRCPPCCIGSIRLAGRFRLGRFRFGTRSLGHSSVRRVCARSRSHSLLVGPTRRRVSQGLPWDTLSAATVASNSEDRLTYHDQTQDDSRTTENAYRISPLVLMNCQINADRQFIPPCARWTTSQRYTTTELMQNRRERTGFQP